MAETVLTARLAEYLDPWRLLGIHRTSVFGPRSSDYVENYARPADYDHPRIRYFMDQIGLGLHRVAPIELDCACDHGFVRARPIMIDGCHRLAGAILAGAPKIRVDFSGRVDLLRYLQGRRKTRPED